MALRFLIEVRAVPVKVFESECVLNVGRSSHQLILRVANVRCLIIRMRVFTARPRFGNHYRLIVGRVRELVKDFVTTNIGRVERPLCPSEGGLS